MQRIRNVLAAASAALLLPAWTAAAEEEEKTVVEDGKSISIEYTLKLDDGTTADSNVGGQPLVYTQGGGQILPALEGALAGLTVNESKQVRLTPEQGYGPVNPQAFQEVEATAIPEDARHEGARLVAQDGQGNQRPVRVHEVEGEKITLDLNHPLAGQHLNFDVKILAIGEPPTPVAP